MLTDNTLTVERRGSSGEPQRPLRDRTAVGLGGVEIDQLDARRAIRSSGARSPRGRGAGRGGRRRTPGRCARCRRRGRAARSPTRGSGIVASVPSPTHVAPGNFTGKSIRCPLTTMSLPLGDRRREALPDELHTDDGEPLVGAVDDLDLELALGRVDPVLGRHRREDPVGDLDLRLGSGGRRLDRRRRRRRSSSWTSRSSRRR